MSAFASPRSSVPPALAPGIEIGARYELIRKLGVGAMGEVWAARHLSLGEEVALKLVVRNVGNEDGSSSDSRFLVEARVAAMLSRKTRHIVGVTDHGEDGSLAYLCMELLEGESLETRLDRSAPLHLTQVVPIISQIARGLAVAHAEGIVHRDLKPSNVFITADEDGKALVKILDFGIAKMRARSDRAALHRTQRGFLLGTPAYMSPEQARGSAVDTRADVWALAVIAYHLLSDAYPFNGDTFEEMFARLCRVEPTPIRDYCPDLPQIVADFFRRAFADKLGDRFQSALALAGAFEQLAPLAADKSVSLPPVMKKSSVPPPVVAGPPTLDELPTDTSIIAAGVPRRRQLRTVVMTSMLLMLLLGVTAAAISLYYERDPKTRTAGPSTVVAPRDTVPLPPPATDPPPVVRASELPPAPSVVTVPPVVRATYARSTNVSLPPPPVEPAVAPVAEPPRPSRRVDKGEVF